MLTKKIKAVFFGTIIGMLVGWAMLMFDGCNTSKFIGYTVFYGILGGVVALFPWIIGM